MRRSSFRPPLEFRSRKFKGLRGFAGEPFHPPRTDVAVGAYTIAPIPLIVAFLFKDSTWAEDAQKAGHGLVTIGGTIGGSLTYDRGFNVETATDNPVCTRASTTSSTLTATDRRKLDRCHAQASTTGERDGSFILGPGLSSSPSAPSAQVKGMW